MGEEDRYAYWKLRGLSLPQRLVIAYGGNKVEIKDYVIEGQEGITDAQEFMRRKAEAEKNGKGEWFSVKQKLGLDFPNLPYLITKDYKITESTAIGRTLARRYDLLGKNEAEFAQIAMLEKMGTEMLSNFFAVVRPGVDFEKERKNWLETALPKWLKQMSDYLGDRDWFVRGSTSPTFADFVWFDRLELQNRFAPDLMAKYPNLVKFVERFGKLPAIEKYLKENQFALWPAFIPIMQWGY